MNRVTPKNPERSDIDDEQEGLPAKRRVQTLLRYLEADLLHIETEAVGSYPTLGSGLSFHFDDSGFLVISAVGADVMGKPWLIALGTGYDGRGRETVVRSPLVSSGF